MVNKNELVGLLQKYGFTEEQINRIVKSKTLIKKGIIEKIEQNLEVLVNNNIHLDNISRCLTVLFKNDCLEIKEIFKVLNAHNISKETIENCLSVLALGKAKEIEEIFEVLNAHNISKETIEKCLSVLAQGEAKEIEEIFKVLDAHNISKETIENCLSVLARGKAKEIEKIFIVLDAHNISKETIENCLSVLRQGKAKEIEEIFEVLNAHNISKETIENCLSVLAQGKTQGKAKEIEEIFEVLNAHNISKETIENCLSVLARGKAKEIEEIFKVLDAHNISKETIENCLYVLARGKAKEIEEKFKILDEYEIPKHNIEENYGIIFLKNINDFTKIFSKLPEDANNENIIMYMKLKGYYNKIVTIEEFNQISAFRNIDIEQIIDANFKKEFFLHHKKTLKEKGELYIGKSIPMKCEDMNKYENIILDISKKISNLLSYRYKYDKQELESYCISILVEKCGDVVYNCNINQEILYRCLYNKAKRYCIGYIVKQKNNFEVDFSKFENTTKTSKYNQHSTKKEELDVKQWNLKSEDEKIMKILSNYLEMGYDNKMAFEKTAKDLDLDIEELMYNIEEIKNQIIENIKENNDKENEER